MRAGIAVATVVLVLVSACGRSSGTASFSPQAQTSAAAGSPAPSPSASPSQSPAQSPNGTTASASAPSPNPAPWSVTSSYGLIEWTGAFGLLSTNGNIAAVIPMAPSAVAKCLGGQPALQGPAVSATADAVYFRDGDTKIRSAAPSGATADVTIVPGGPGVVSFFSVSPDDKKIAFVTEDLTNATAQIRLDVQDLTGGNNMQLASTSAPQAGGTTMWPMGWHNGNLVVAIVPICGANDAPISPSEFRVLDITTGQQIADLTGPCTMSEWASPAGVTCAVQGVTSIRIIDWTGHAIAVGSEPGSTVSGLSTAGDKFFVATGDQASAQYDTWIVRRSSGVSTPVTEHAACLWVDDNHLMAPDAVIDATTNDMGFPSGSVSTIGYRGTCAGRFPGGL